MAFPRPSTAGGLSTRQGGNNNKFEKRMSKDDSVLNIGGRRPMHPGMAQNRSASRDDIYVRDRTSTASPRFHVPVRGSTITPDQSPHFIGSREALIPIRLPTPESITSGDIPIGMALGSPAHIPSEPSRWQAQFPPASPQMTDQSSFPSPAMSAPGGSLQRKKTGRRKLFGLFSSKKNASEEGNRGVTNIMKSSHGSTATVSTLPNAPKTPTRSNTQSDVRTPKHKPLTLRSNTMPHNNGDTPDSTSNSSVTHLRQTNALPPVPPIPRLEVRIPDTKMERYSVMFSDLLKENGRPEPSTSLLARRQATLERLKTINGNNGGYELEPVQEDDRVRPRRATSPQPQALSHPGPAFVAETVQPSPRLSVFPIPPTGRPNYPVGAQMAHLRPARSNTSPARLPSPTQPTFDRRLKAPMERGTPNLEVPNPFQMNPPDSSMSSSKAQEPIYPTDTSFHFGPDQSALLLDSPTSMDSQEEIIISQPFKPTLHEPQWQMVSPATTNTSVFTASSGRPGRSPSGGSSSTHVTKPSSELDPQDAALQDAVQVSIARQISISRQQRNLLRPLNTRRGTETTKPGGVVPNSAGSSMLGDSRSPIGVTVVKAPSPSRLGKDEPIKETKSSTPTLVHRRGSPVDPQNRKSSWVVLESD
ncbi:hypothetical protein N0V82_001596 [Gnomoniopsis sp. IMI 355080]|nr:hypothetical protein N0V82_001596 [Gnomoniopsis sp. IMI 355080]